MIKYLIIKNKKQDFILFIVNINVKFAILFLFFMLVLKWTFFFKTCESAKSIFVVAIFVVQLSKLLFVHSMKIENLKQCREQNQK